MTPEQIEKWAREAGFVLQRDELAFRDMLTEFARLVAQDTWERADSLTEEVLYPPPPYETASRADYFSGATACRNSIKAALRAAAAQEAKS